MFGDQAKIVGTYQVYNWNWDVMPHERGTLITDPQVTLIEIQLPPGTPIYVPSSEYGIGYRSTATARLAHDDSFLTLNFDKDLHGGISHGPAIQIAGINIDPGLVDSYRAMANNGRGILPGVAAGQVIGVVGKEPIFLVYRSDGNFLDPREEALWGDNKLSNKQYQLVYPNPADRQLRVK